MEWTTTVRPHIDRCATAWLVKRFIDPDARFSFVQPGEAVPSGATPFDMPGAKHGHRGSLCTFEVVLKDYKLDGDPALVRVAAIVHDIDFHLLKRAESAGLDAIIRGLNLALPEDHVVLERAGYALDALYALEQARLKKGGA